MTPFSAYPLPTARVQDGSRVRVVAPRSALRLRLRIDDSHFCAVTLENGPKRDCPLLDGMRWLYAVTALLNDRDVALRRGKLTGIAQTKMGFHGHDNDHRWRNS